MDHSNDIMLFSRSGKQTAYQFLCFNKKKTDEEGIEIEDPRLHAQQKREQKIMSKMPKEILYEKIKSDLQGKDTNIIKEYIQQEEKKRRQKQQKEFSNSSKVQQLAPIQEEKQTQSQLLQQSTQPNPLGKAPTLTDSKMNKTLTSNIMNQTNSRNVGDLNATSMHFESNMGVFNGSQSFKKVKVFSKGQSSSFKSVPREQVSLFYKQNSYSSDGYKYNPKLSVVKKKIANEFKFKYSDPVEPRSKVESDHICTKGHESCMHSVNRAVSLMQRYKSEIRKQNAEQCLSMPPIVQNPQDTNYPLKKCEEMTPLEMNQELKSQNKDIFEFLGQTQVLDQKIQQGQKIKIKSPVHMDRSRIKKSIFQELNGPHEARFENLNLMPTNLSNYTNVDVVDFKRYAIRDMHRDNQNLKNPRTLRPQPAYQPNYEFTKKSLSLGLTPFEKQTDRSEVLNLSGHRSGNNITPNMYTYMDKAREGYFKLSNIKDNQPTLDFSKTSARDNSMYLISDGYNLEPKHESFLDKIIDLNVSSLRNKKVANILKDVVSQNSQFDQGTLPTGDYNSNTFITERSMTKDLEHSMSKINKFYRLAKNKYKIINSKGFSKELSQELTRDDVKGLTLEQKLLAGYYRSESTAVNSELQSNKRSKSTLHTSIRPSVQYSNL
eukprot:403376904